MRSALFQSSDQSLSRLEAAALVELGLGLPRPEIAFRLLTVAIGMLAELDCDGRSVADLAHGLRDVAERLEEMA
jgi:hypothetical protein